MTTTPDARTATHTAETIATRLRRWAQRTPDAVALREKFLGVWRDITWAEYWDHAQWVAHGLMALGVEPGDRVAIHSENRPEWVYADVGIVAARAMTMGLYPTNPPAEVSYLLADSGSKVLIAEDQEQVDKALEVKDKTPDLERIIYIEPRGVRSYDDPLLMSWEDFLELGREHREHHPQLLEQRMAEATEADICTLIYTSGTTGAPKGAMLSVGNVNFAIQALVQEGGFVDPPPTVDDVLLSYLPLCHIAERIVTVWFNLSSGCCVHFAESIETVQQNLQEIQPTLFLGVPRIWEKIHASIDIKMASASLLKRLNYALWMKAAGRIATERAANDGALTTRSRLLYALAYPLLFRTLKDRIGMRKIRHPLSGAAPVSADLLRWFWGIGVPIYEAYGMTENSAVATANRPGRTKLGTVGEPHPGVELKIVRPDGTEVDRPEHGDSEPGEVLTRHPGVFQGYWQKPDKTAEVLEPDGWLHTGDVGVWVDGTHVKIVDRVKDIIITGGGKNISPSEIENALKASAFIKEAVIIGDNRPYLSALIGIEYDTVGEWAQRRGLPYTTYRDLSEKQEVKKLVQGVIDEVNERFARAENIRKFRMLPKELDHEDGELTATQKVKRSAISEMFADLIEDMYGKR